MLHLAVIIAESKYIDAANLATKRKESQKQLRDTVRRINDAIFGDKKRLDRDLWMARFSDLMLSGIQFPANSDEATLNLKKLGNFVVHGRTSLFLTR